MSVSPNEPSSEYGLPTTLAEGHVVTVRREENRYPISYGPNKGQERVDVYFKVDCTCGEVEDVTGYSFGGRDEPNYMQQGKLDDFLARHKRVADGERGMYACGCLHEGRRTKECSTHRKPYIPKVPSNYKPAKMPASEVLRCLGFEYPSPEWAFFGELRLGTGWSYGNTDGLKIEQRLDAFAMNTWPSKGFHRIAFEIKVSRADFRHEIARPDKRACALTLANYFYFATPQGLVKPEEIPEECGLIEIKPTGGRIVTVRAPFREVDPLPTRFVASLARRIDREQTPAQEQLARRGVCEVNFPADWTDGDPLPEPRYFVAENCKHCGTEREVTE